MKRFLSVLLAVVMIMSMVPAVFAATYSDTADSDYANAIEFLSGLGVVSGYEDGTFLPEKVVTRAEMSKLLVVALGLDAGADLLKGTSSFDDVPTTHWATGYIAVAVQYGLIKGDGDGNFRPDDTVNYAEAATMILRALGYDRVVDKNGQWPTNYLNKANELLIFDELGKFGGTDGATRETIAQMIWNMMNTRMWEVAAETEGDGLTYAQGATMIASKYPKYEAHVKNNAAGLADIVVDTTKKDEPIVKLEFDDGNIGTYAGNDFYTFVVGTEMEYLLKEGKDNDEIVAVFATDNNYLFEGTAEELNDKFTTIGLTEGQGDYFYALMNGNKSSSAIIDATVLWGADVAYVEEVKEYSGNKFTFTDGIVESGKYDESDVASTLVLNGNERVKLTDVKEGDVLTTVEFNGAPLANFMLVSRGNTASGSVTKFDTNKNALVVGGTSYVVSASATMKIDPENEDSDAESFWDLKPAGGNFNGTSTYSIADFKDVDTKVVLDAVGRVVRVEAESLKDEAETTIGFFVGASADWSTSTEDGAEYRIKLTDVNGKTSTYVFAEDYDDTNTFFGPLPFGMTKDDALYTLAPFFAEFDKEGKIVAIEPITDGANYYKGFGEDVNNGNTANLTAITDLDKIYVAEEADGSTPAKELSYDKDAGTLTVGAGGTYKVTSSTKLITILKDDSGDKTTYSVEVETGKDAFKGIKGAGMAIYTDGTFPTLHYVFAKDDSRVSDLMYGTVKEVVEDAVNEQFEITVVSGTKETTYVVADTTADKAIAGGMVGMEENHAFVTYQLNSEDELIFSTVLYDVDIDGTAPYVLELNGNREAKFSATVGAAPFNSTIIDFDAEAIEDEIDDREILVLSVDWDDLDDDGTLDADEIVFTGVTSYTYDSLKLAKKDAWFGYDATSDVYFMVKYTKAIQNEWGL